MAVVPYSQDWQVILSRRQSNDRDSLVLYNAQNKQLAVHQSDRISTGRSQSAAPSHPPEIFCPYCRRPFQVDQAISVEKGSFMDSDYFKFLETVQGQQSRSGTLPPSNSHPSPVGLSQKSMNSGYYARFFQEQKRLGRGARGAVFLCTHVLDGIALASYAVKKVPIGDDRSWLVKMLHEVRLLEKLRHPHIVQYNHVWIEENITLNQFGPPVACLMILMEYCNGGDLESYMKDRSTAAQANSNSIFAARRRRRSIVADAMPQPVFDAAEIWRLFIEITTGLNHLHTHKILHRDLKAQNVLLSFEDIQGNMSAKPRAVISDFGEGQIIAETASRRTGYTGTIEWSAPEVVSDYDGRFNDFTTKSDMWSLGMILYFLIHERLPYTHMDDVDKLRREIGDYAYGRHGGLQVRADAGEEIPGILAKLLERQPKRRPECMELLEAIGMQGMQRMPSPMERASHKDKIRPVSMGSTPYGTDDEDEGLMLRATPPIIVPDDSHKIERIPSEVSFANASMFADSISSNRNKPRRSGLSVEWNANGHDLVPRRTTPQATSNTGTSLREDAKSIFALRVGVFLVKMMTLPSAHPIIRYGLVLLALLDFYDPQRISVAETTILAGLHLASVILLRALI